MKKLLVALLMVAVLSVPALAGFSKSRQYMSGRGYARWQYFLATGVWRHR